ncbi:acetyl esterase [Nocardioides massiliensis]|uniref:Acetyl esterase n=2 Tax=Nocardioides massiliensis TaxID=1325935 RepID=A0ABT9NMU9_9ACTN|nr:alpha/beta hydrolase [Nocardioides massiliensis]MDP9821741.1 acetyl esterase [Nocardioides massiliensis]
MSSRVGGATGDTAAGSERLRAVVRRLGAAGDVVQGVALRRLMGLPEGVQRRLVGRPVVRDGLTLATEIQLLFALQRLMGEDGLDAEDHASDEARRDLVRQARLASGNPPIGGSHDLVVDGAAGPLDARLYIPRALLRASEVPGGLTPLSGTADPLLIWYHGGGMLRGDLDSHDAVCRVLAEEAGCRVLSVAYRLAPEHPFPAGADDAFAAYRWVLRNAAGIGADPERVALGGDSAGAYLAAVASLEAVAAGMAPAYQLLVYPVTDWGALAADRESRSRKLFDAGFLLTRDFMNAAEAAYLGSADPDDPRLNLHRAELAGLPPTYVCTAGFDPLRDEGERFVEELRAAGVEVTHQRFAPLIHAFVHLMGGRESRGALSAIATALRRGLVG